MDRLFVYSVLLGNTEERAREFLSRNGIDYLIVSRNGTEYKNRLHRSYTRILLSIFEGRVSKVEWR
jgi:hypothetical protein